jgi:hypothetical protein
VSGRGPIFRPGASAKFRACLLLGFVLLLAVTDAGYAFYHSPWWSRVGFASDQPVLFSHRHHAAELRIDCRYCHSSVETSPFAGMPPTETCLSCHSQIFGTTALLRPVVVSAETNQPLRWNRVTRMPDFVYFDHQIHVAKGIGCTSCHGAIGSMALTAKGERLDMRQCLECHRDPRPFLRPSAEIFLPAWTPPADQAARGAALAAHYGLALRHLTNCSTCHR